MWGLQIQQRPSW